MTSDEGVRRGAAAIVLRAARELAKHAAHRPVALGRGDQRGEVRRGSAVDRTRLRVEGDGRYDELPALVGADRRIRARTERRRAEIVDVRGKAHAEIPERKDRRDAEAPLAELAGASRAIEAHPRPAG